MGLQKPPTSGIPDAEEVPVEEEALEVCLYMAISGISPPTSILSSVLPDAGVPLAFTWAQEERTSRGVARSV